ncbi:hypothetical protein LSPH24S_09390 [Lysinibacillus sphaericus]
MRKLTFYLTCVLMLLLTACSSTEKSQIDSSKDAKAQGKNNVQTILVGTGTQFPNICFLDDKGNLTGYDVELVRAIDKKLPEYNFEFKTMEFSNLLLSLERERNSSRFNRTSDGVSIVVEWFAHQAKRGFRLIVKGGI